jgi:hypothetical protein
MLLALAGAFALGPSLAARAQEAEPEIPAPDGAEIDDPTARLFNQIETFGRVTSAFRKNEIKQVNLHNTKKNAPGPRWVNIGPTGADFEQNGSFSGHVRDSGRARAILSHPTEADIVYVLTSGGGLWRTNNWTSPNTTWTPISDNLDTTGGGSVSFGRNANTLYLGLGDPYDQILAGGAVVKSTNGGNSWGAIQQLGNAVSVREIRVDSNGKLDVVMVGTDQGLFRSTNEGTSYPAVGAFGTESVWSIVKTSAGWLASSQPCAVNLNSTRPYGVLCGTATTLRYSTDRGATWSPIPNTGGGFGANGRTTLAVGKPGDAVVYAYSSKVDESALNDVYRSTDGGLSWTATGTNSTKAPTNPVAEQTNMQICGGQCWYDQMIVVDPFDPNRNTVWIGGNLATAASTDGGATWALKTWWLYSQYPAIPYAHADHHTAAFKTTGPATLILGNDGGFNVSTDGGTTFSSDKNNGLTTHLYYSIAGTAGYPNFVIGGLQDNGTRARNDNGTIYNQVIGGDGLGAAASIDNTNTVMGSSQGSGIRTNLTNVAPDVYQNQVARGSLSDGAGAPFSTCVVPAPAGLDSTGRVFFHFTASRVWRTNNGGLSFSLIGQAGAGGIPVSRRFRSSVTNLGVSPQDLNHIAVGAGGGFIDVTADGGATWTDIDLTTKANFTGFVTGVTWEDNQNLWVTSSALVGNNLARVLKGHINNPGDPWSGATWTVMQSGLPDLPVQHVLFDPRDPHNTIYAASHVGIYRSTDGGNSWAPYGNGLPTVRVGQIYMPPDGSFIRIATYGRGNWELGQLELVRATLTDDVLSCDNDGALDNGEVGTLRVTLINQGANNVNQGTITFSSTNPHVTFPNGAVTNFTPSLGPKQTGVATITVAVNGAVGIEVADIHIAVDVPQLALGSNFNLSTTQRVNYDDVAGAFATDTFESSASAWTFSGDPVESPNVLASRIRALSPVQHAAWLPDNNGQIDDVKPSLPSDTYMTSPVLNVDASNPLVLSFTHRFSFESGGWDGGVVEISTDGGATWTKVTGGGFYNGTTNASTNATIGASTAAFVNRSSTWPNFIPATVNLGTTYAGMNVQFRFHSSADDSTGAPGWDVDDVQISGITNTPFSGLTANACSF